MLSHTRMGWVDMVLSGVEKIQKGAWQVSLLTGNPPVRAEAWRSCKNRWPPVNPLQHKIQVRN